MTKVTLMRIDELRGFGIETRRFAAVVFGALLLMIGLFVVSIANVRRSEIHKRLMFVLMAGMMTPAVARLFLTFLPLSSARCFTTGEHAADHTKSMCWTRATHRAADPGSNDVEHSMVAGGRDVDRALRRLM